MARRASMPRKSGKKTVYPASFGFSGDLRPVSVGDLQPLVDRPPTEHELSQVMRRDYNGASMVLMPPREVDTKRAREILLAERFGR